MFTTGFEKTALPQGAGTPHAGTTASSPKTLQNLTGAPAIKPFGKTMGKFGQRPRTGLMSITRLRDGLK